MEKSKLELAIDKAQSASNQANVKIAELGGYTSKMFTALNDIQHQFDLIRNIPSDKQIIITSLNKTRITWKQQVEKIEADYKNTMSAYKSSGAAGTSLGVGVAALGPTAAMGFATTFGVASTGTAISTLSGAAATNAALAWLGGGTLVAGGGGIAAGNALLAMAGPVGWGIAAVSLITSGILYWRAKNEKERLENIYTLISERDIKKYRTAILEINERINHINIEHNQIIEGIQKIKTFGYDYKSMTSQQQYALGTYVNLMESSTKLLVNPILGLQPSYTEEDYYEFNNSSSHIRYLITKDFLDLLMNNKKAIIALANLLYNVTTDSDDRETLSKSFKKNDDFLKSLGFTKDNYPDELLNVVNEALIYKYNNPNPRKNGDNSNRISKYTLYQVENIVKGIIIQEIPKDKKPDHIYKSHYLSNLGVHVGTLCAKLENIFGIKISNNDVRNINKVEDAVKVVMSYM